MTRCIDLSHRIGHGTVTYPGLPGPVIADYLRREDSRSHYAAGTEFQIGKIEMVANTGTYLDTPFHRYADGKDLAQFDLSALANLPAVVVRAGSAKSIGKDALAGIPARGAAVLVHTGWSRHWGTARYSEGHPFLTADAALWLCEAGAALVGIDSLNIDDVADLTRPVHSELLRRGIAIVEHLTNLEQVPTHGARFFAVPPMIEGMGTFPVRAFCLAD